MLLTPESRVAKPNAGRFRERAARDLSLLDREVEELPLEGVAPELARATVPSTIAAVREGRGVSRGDRGDPAVTDLAIQTEALSKRFASTWALRDLSLTVRRASAFGFVGPNGAGKTTMIRLLNGLLAPTSGRARLFGEDATRGTECLRRRCSVVTDSNLYERLTADDNLALWADLYGVSRRDATRRTDALLARFGLEHRRAERVATYSRGMKQRLALARALLTDPDMLFLDEVTAGLDPEASHDFVGLALELVRARGCTVFYASHRLEEVEALCDTIAILDRGVLLACGSLQDLVERYWPGVDYDIALEGDARSYEAPVQHAVRGVSTSARGTTLHLHAADRTAIPEVIRALVGSGARVMGAAERRRGLREVYLEIMRRSADETARR